MTVEVRACRSAGVCCQYIKKISDGSISAGDYSGFFYLTELEIAIISNNNIFLIE